MTEPYLNTKHLTKLESCSADPAERVDDPLGVGVRQEDASLQQRVRFLGLPDAERPFRGLGHDADSETFKVDKGLRLFEAH